MTKAYTATLTITNSYKGSAPYTSKEIEGLIKQADIFDKHDRLTLTVVAVSVVSRRHIASKPKQLKPKVRAPKV